MSAAETADEALRPVQRTAAYAVVTAPEGVLLVRASARSDFAGRWFLPGGGVRHGEDPAAAVVREVREETGLEVELRGLRGAVSDVLELPHRGLTVHTVRLLFEAAPAGGALRAEPDGTSDLPRFVPPDELTGLPLMPYVADVLGVPADEVVAGVPERPEPVGGSAGDRPVIGPDGEPVFRMQRPAAYAVLRDGDRMLLSQLRGHEGMWTLPGGGIDFGEPPVEALVREVHEEAGLPLSPGRLLEVTSRHFTGRSPDGRLEDFHGIRLIWSGSVPTDVEPRVIEVDGSTVRSAWVPLVDLDELLLSDVVQSGLRHAFGPDAPR